jgi:hypothetical protein
MRRVMTGGRYPVLRALAILYVIGAALAVLATVVGIVWALAFSGYFAWDRIVLALGVLAIGFFTVISLLAIAEVLKLFIDVEHNTRLAATSAVATTGRMMGPAATTDGGRLAELDEETAEGALLRGH